MNLFLLFCLLCLAGTYGMVGNILTLIGTNFAERLIYLPSAFFLMIVGTLLACIPIRARTVLLSIALALASVRTFTAARQWNHPLILFQQAVELEPRSIQLHLLLSREYHLAGNIPAAQEEMQQVCNMYPDYWRVWMHRALEDMDDRDLIDADKSIKRAIKLKGEPRLIAVADRLETLKAATRASTRSD